jgi:hypothetical protein
MNDRSLFQVRSYYPSIPQLSSTVRIGVLRLGFKPRPLRTGVGDWVYPSAPDDGNRYNCENIVFSTLQNTGQGTRSQSPVIRTQSPVTTEYLSNEVQRDTTVAVSNGNHDATCAETTAT